ncbi:MAG: amino acid carrier protein [Rickettsiales bacterium]
MVDSFFEVLNAVDEFFWSYIGIYLVVISGLYFTIRNKGYQFKVLKQFSKTYTDLNKVSQNKTDPGINPFKLYFASVGGMVGLGNIVIIITSVTHGGPGVLVWLWIASLAGMMIKYSEIYLGVKYRKANKKGGYDGGPMYYLQAAFGNKFMPVIACIMLCIYGIEVSQFKIITDTISHTYEVDAKAVMAILLFVTLYTAIGGIKRMANFCSVLMPPFMIIYIIMCLFVIINNYDVLPEVMKTVFISAFKGHAPVAGFVGSTFLMAAQFGVARAVYSGDIAIGYDSVVQSETKTKHPELQGKLAIFSQLTDSFICTLSILVVLVTGVWYDPSITDPSGYVIKALSAHFPHIDLFMSLLFFLAGFTTVIAYFAVGLKSAKFLNKTWGKRIYLIYAIVAFITTYYTTQENVITVMSLSAGVLVLINILGILKLQSKIKFI